MGKSLSDCGFAFSGARVLSGSEEGLLGWVALNYASGALQVRGGRGVCVLGRGVLGVGVTWQWEGVEGGGTSMVLAVGHSIRFRCTACVCGWGGGEGWGEGVLMGGGCSGLAVRRGCWAGWHSTTLQGHCRCVGGGVSKGEHMMLAGGRWLVDLQG